MISRPHSQRFSLSTYGILIFKCSQVILMFKWRKTKHNSSKPKSANRTHLGTLSYISSQSGEVGILIPPKKGVFRGQGFKVMHQGPGYESVCAILHLLLFLSSIRVFHNVSLLIADFFSCMSTCLPHYQKP